MEKCIGINKLEKIVSLFKKQKVDDIYIKVEKDGIFSIEEYKHDNSATYKIELNDESCSDDELIFEVKSWINLKNNE